MTLTSNTPKYLHDLVQGLIATSAADTTVVGKWLLIPSSDECPSPGQARNWGRNEWSKWCDEHNFVFDGERTHAWTWCHVLFNNLKIGVAKTPGDVRTPMACAMQVRRSIRETLITANILIRGLFNNSHGEELWKKHLVGHNSEDLCKRHVVAMMHDKKNESLVKLSGDESAALLLDPNEKETYTIGRLKSLLAKCSEFGMSPRAVLMSLYGNEEGARTWETIKLIPDDAPSTRTAYEDVKDQLELLKETDRAEREQRQTERANREKEREAALAAKNRPPTLQEAVQQLVNQSHAGNQKSLDGLITFGEGVMRQFGSLLDRARLARQNLSAAIVPPIEDSAPLKADLAATRQENDILRQSRDESCAKVEALLLQIDEERSKQVSPDTVKKLQEDKAALLAVVGLIGDAYVAVQKAGPFEIVRILEDLSNNAKEVLKNHG